MSAIFIHCVSYYNALSQTAEPEETTGSKTDTVFRGHTTKVFKSLSLPDPYYPRIMTYLAEMGCITQVARGSRNSLSVLVLHKKPTEDAFLAIDPEDINGRRDRRNAQDKIRDQQVRDMEKRLGELEKAFWRSVGKPID